jgi:UDPglucose 6-dehydrogenase
MRVGVIGTGYVGLVTGTCLAETGHDVVCMDVATAKIAALERGEMPIYEPGLEEMVRRNARDGRLRFTSDLETTVVGAEVVFIAVGTPPDEDGSADRRYVLAAADGIGRYLNEPLVIVVKSTVPVGTCDMVRDRVAEVLEARGVAVPFAVVSNPEFLKEGKAIEDFMRPDRIVIGAPDEGSAAVMERLYASFLRNGHPVISMSVRSAELTKYTANVMLATRISLMNEIAQICDRVGADIMDVRRGVGTDARIGMSFLYAGVGYGGSCFPKDVQALSRVALEAGVTSDILAAVESVNRAQKMLLANRVIAAFGGSVRGKRVAVWGIAFKPDTDDIREAPALTIIKRLTEAGASVVAYDPEAMPNAARLLAGNARVSFVETPYAAAEAADALLLITEWRVFRGLDLGRVAKSMSGKLLFDGRNQYDPDEVRALGFDYHCIGRGAP